MLEEAENEEGDICDKCCDNGSTIDGRQWMAQAMINMLPACYKHNKDMSEIAGEAANLVEAGWFALREKLDEWDSEDEAVEENSGTD